ncbi:hypothetical protein [Marinobacter sp. C2H3]|uniref:hypothetical protein n=1 Tax=Marinobacter sp. C2H3 TaxID=3119003 RepID=UPI00300F22D4
MNSLFSPLPVQDLTRTSAMTTARPQSRIGLEDAAVHVMTDYAENKPATLASDMMVSEARLWMRLADTPIKLVENQAGDCIGILTIQDVNGEKPMVVANRQGVALRDVRVRDIMRALGDLPAIHYRDLRAATIGDLVRTFEDVHEEYLMVLDDRQSTGQDYLRGLIAARELANRLDLSLDLEHRATRFYEIVNVVQNGL